MNKRSHSTRHTSPNKMDPRWLERITKGYANHLRIQILQLLTIKPEMSLGDICELLNMEITNGSEHVRKLTSAGLVVKRKQKQRVCHRVTDRGKKILSFLKTLK